MKAMQYQGYGDPSRLTLAEVPRPMRKRVKVIGVKPRGADLDELRRLCEAGALRPVIEKRFALEELAAAHAYSRHGRTAGKIAIIMDGTRAGSGGRPVRSPP